MYRFWEPFILPALERLKPKVLIEIGSDQGLNTRNLLDFSRRTGAILHVIDPLPKYDVEEWVNEYHANLEFHMAPSLDVLRSIDNADVVLIDGDHNWYTVFNELKLLEEIALDSPGRFPIVMLHDVGWPYGRRDLYYEPDRIPPPDRHPYAKGGLRPGREDLDPAGGLNAHLDNALREGGPRNGVLTAIEDFISESSIDLKLVVIPGINDLGILFPTDVSSVNSQLGEFIEDMVGQPNLRLLMDRVERLRVEAQIEAADKTRDRDQLRSANADQRHRIGDLEGTVKSLSDERSALTAEQKALTAERSRLRTQVDSLEAEAREKQATREAEKEKLVAMEGDLKTLRSELRSVRRELGTARKKLALSDKRYKRLRSRRSVRLALGMASLAAPFVRSTRRIRKGFGPAGPSDAKAADVRPSNAWPLGVNAQSRFARAVTKERPGSPSVSGPLVSIIILTRDGAEHMRRLLGKLDTGTHYRSFEVIVVDNGSTDGTSEVLNLSRSYPVRVISNDHNTSFSHGNNQGVEVASGELLLFLNNDVDPINPGWLGAMVDAASIDESVVAVGAELVYPVRGESVSDLTVQHAGIRFGFRQASIHAINIATPDPLDKSTSRMSPVPAATAAALLVEASAFRRVGGFDEGYVYGTEDVDLCLRLGELGNIVVTGQAVLFHYESATQTRVSAELTQINRAGNHQRLAEHWAPRLMRSVTRDRLTGSGRYTGRVSRTVAITLTHNDEEQGWGDYYTAHELGDAFEKEGWSVVYAERYQDHWYEIGQDVDLLVSLLDSFDVRKAPPGAVKVAWIRNWVDRWIEQPWFDSFDFVTVSSHKAASLISERSRFVPYVVPLATNPELFQPGPPHPTFQADYVFTGNNWGQGRDVVRQLDVQPGERFLMFGKGWERDPRVTRYWRGSVEYKMLPDIYRSAKIVLDDTATPTLPYAFLNGRVFDALSAGALVLTDNVEGSHEMFGGLLPTYSDRAELRALLDRYLNDDAARTALVRDLQSQVSSRHIYASRPIEITNLALNELERPRVAVKIGVPDTDSMPSWGDTHFAYGLAAALARVGMPTEVHILPEWDLPEKQAADVVIHLRGLTSYSPKPAHVNVLWIISHPDDVTPRECEKYDLVLVASRKHAEWLQTHISIPVVFLPQATDGRRFGPVEPRVDLASDVLFLGNSRGQRRKAVDWAIKRDLPLTVYGGGWTGRIPSRFVRAEHFPNEDLAALYASTKVVLNDHWPDMRDRGFVSNRIFDALASGAVVVSDPVVGLEEIFGDLVPTYSTPDELEHVVLDLIHDGERRKIIQSKALAIVATQHTFDKRAEDIYKLLRPLLDGRIKDLQGSTFDLSSGLSDSGSRRIPSD